ncbi:alpha/beta hydrolase [Brevibacillus migulae]|uniref:alpha/beta hydrolase n=1 Tax=Brevibacillus migulae TaxID=1644114 RepID=UPI00106EB029|nr:alpha/beta hydrolase [Brevibacillus migulae]
MEVFHWEKEPIRGAVVVVHGTGEHHGRYSHVVRALNDHGFQAWAGDLPGWGKADGRKGHIDSFDDYLGTVDSWVDAARNQLPQELPLYLFGHSMGGLVAVRYAEVYGAERLDGLVLSSPCLQLKLAVPRWKVELAGYLNRVWPTLRIANGITPEMVTRDSTVRVQYQTDPLNYPKASVRWFNELLRAMELAWKEKDQLRLPTLIMQAGADQLVDPVAVAAFARELPYPEKQYIEYDGFYHEILNEPERDQVLADLVRWLHNQQAKT